MKKRLLLIGWDSADWKIAHPLIDQGTMQGLKHLVENGVSGNITTLEPQLSPMLWTSIATGKHAYHHGVHGFTEVDPGTGRIVPVSAATRQCKTVWEMLGERGLRSHVVSWFATQGEQNHHGKMVSNMFAHLQGVKEDQDPADWPAPMPGTFWPESLAEEMHDLRVSPWEIDGNEIIQAFVPDAPQVDQEKDKRLWHLAEKLAEAYSVQSAATHLMETDPDWDFMAVYFRAPDEISHMFMPYHPPKMEGIPEEDFERYKEVVNSTYKAHDLMLQRLIQLAGTETAIILVSDHGFHSDHLRPKFTPRVPAGIIVWHRPQGIITATGPGFKQDELLYGARLLDVAPTVLSYFGLPVGEDMEGRVLAEAFAEPPPVNTIPTWEDPEGHAKERGALSDADSKALLDQFVALGYIEEVSENMTEAAAETNRENDWNLARACMHGGRMEQALPLLEGIYEGYPHRNDFAQLLCRCQIRLGLLDEAAATAEAMLESFGSNEAGHMLQAHIAFEKQEFGEALRELDIIREKKSGELTILQLLSRTYLLLRDWKAAEAAARKVLEQDPHNAQAFLVLARTSLRKNHPQAAADFALDTVGLQYGNPQGHFLLGVALIRLEDWGNAKQALQNTVKLNPDLLAAHRLLAFVYQQLGEPGNKLLSTHEARTRRAAAIEVTRERLGQLQEEARERAAQRRVVREKKNKEEAKQQAEAEAVEPINFVLVSGLPRSGTSLMMQMLAAGGLELMTDTQRVADEDNPEGYWEWEDIKKLPKNPRILEQAKGKVVKVISALLPCLPTRHRYKIIFMKRPVEEVVQSQWTMLDHHGKTPASEEDHLVATQQKHVETVLGIFKLSEQVELLEVDYPSLVLNPQKEIARVVDFLGANSLPNAKAMTQAVKPELYRNRGGVNSRR